MLNGGIRIIEDPLLYHLIPNRKHRKKRINKKWAKRYGYTKKPDESIYKIGINTIVCHPQIAQKIRESIPKA